MYLIVSMLFLEICLTKFVIFIIIDVIVLTFGSNIELVLQRKNYIFICYRNLTI